MLYYDFYNCQKPSAEQGHAFHVLHPFFFWQDANGKIGLTAAGIQVKPIEMLPGETVIKIASGGDHLLCLTEKGEIYSCGK